MIFGLGQPERRSQRAGSPLRQPALYLPSKDIRRLTEGREEDIVSKTRHQINVMFFIMYIDFVRYIFYIENIGGRHDRWSSQEFRAWAQLEAAG